MISRSHGVLLDCDYIIALTIPHESTHAKAKKIRESLFETPQFILVSTLYELATVCSRKFDHAFACNVLRNIEAADIKRLSVQDIEAEAWKEYYAQTRKSTSFFDCANLAAAKHYSLKIASFDSFYPKDMVAA